MFRMAQGIVLVQEALSLESLCYTFLLDERLVSLYFFGVIPVSRLKKLVKAGELGKFRRSAINSMTILCKYIDAISLGFALSKDTHL